MTSKVFLLLANRRVPCNCGISKGVCLARISVFTHIFQIKVKGTRKFKNYFVTHPPTPFILSILVPFCLFSFLYHIFLPPGGSFFHPRGRCIALAGNLISLSQSPKLRVCIVQESRAIHNGPFPGKGRIFLGHLYI